MLLQGAAAATVVSEVASRAGEVGVGPSQPSATRSVASAATPRKVRPDIVASGRGTPDETVERCDLAPALRRVGDVRSAARSGADIVRCDMKQTTTSTSGTRSGHRGDPHRTSLGALAHGRATNVASMGQDVQCGLIGWAAFRLGDLLASGHLS